MRRVVARASSTVYSNLGYFGAPSSSVSVGVEGPIVAVHRYPRATATCSRTPRNYFSRETTYTESTAAGVPRRGAGWSPTRSSTRPLCATVARPVHTAVAGTLNRAVAGAAADTCVVLERARRARRPEIVRLRRNGEVVFSGPSSKCALSELRMRMYLLKTHRSGSSRACARVRA